MQYSLAHQLGKRSGGLDPDAKAYIAAVETADGQALEPAIRTAYDQFIRGCKSDGIWDAIKASCILSGARSLSGALVPLVGAAPTNNNFVSGDYVRTTGLVGNGSTKYLDTNRSTSSDPQDNFHLSAYVTAAHTSGSAGAYLGHGVLSGGTGDSNFGRSGSNPANIFMRNRSASAAASAGNGAATGFMGQSRATSGAYSSRDAGTTTAARLVVSGSPAVENINVFRLTDGNAYTNARIAFYSIGEAIDLAALDARLATLTAAIAAALP